MLKALILPIYRESLDGLMFLTQSRQTCKTDLDEFGTETNYSLE